MRKSMTGIVVLIMKLGPKVMSLLMKLLKGAKVTKVGLAGASMASYAYMFTWEFAAMIMLMLFVHESGHIWAMKRCGIKTKGIYFIPFVGGAAVAEEAFPSRGAETYIAIMGPIWGGLLAAVSMLAYYETQSPMFAAAAAWMAMVNVFNLIPINPLDGGRILKSIAFSIDRTFGLAFMLMGLVVSIFAMFYFRAGLFVLLVLIGFMELLGEYGRHKRSLDELSEELDMEREGYYPVATRRRVLPRMHAATTAISVVAYVSTTAILWLMMSAMNHVPGAAEAMKILTH